MLYVHLIKPEIINRNFCTIEVLFKDLIEITFPNDPLPSTFIKLKSSMVKWCCRFAELSSYDTDGGGVGFFVVFVVASAVVGTENYSLKYLLWDSQIEYFYRKENLNDKSYWYII